MKNRLFVGCYLTGLIYADKQIEENGDFQKIAYLNYKTLNLTVYKPRSPLLKEVYKDSEEIQSKRGQKFRIAGNCEITLGE